ncbi:alpha-L-rhamnosidase [Amycolatopsis bartoniae]|uniref:alpha-L-rhamnosidase n=1 Tax=Amycolatopsis bartoniae TaxID=941986 RepID=A0A8H9IWT6_9PSEU|nr:glycoside hydrolase family 78 protein [Amycolatopsis bartoniae]MBB2940079.1 alpha-L-rhamnosidase [Amycolatopsis bartoniae]TVT09444.1 Bacterial alpha-L-rhamnosidase [Amycolatopsis bartoniae]GHF53797.1 alpha-L-rhamnosidase [Amycolatopsis bartoniae]
MPPETTIGPVRFEHLDDPLGVGVSRPRLSWQVSTGDPDWAQTAYEVERDGEVVRVESAEQVLVPWPFAPLASRERATVRVRVASGGVWSSWSAPSTVECGLLSPGDWSARFVSPAGLDGPAPILSRAFVLRPGVVSARLYATAHGVYQAELNGQRVGDLVLAPGWTSYRHRLRYQTYDVTPLLSEGENSLDVTLGNGWFRGRLGWTGGRAHYGDRLALLAQLEVTYADGTRETIGTDETWTARTGAIQADDLYDGQHTDFTAAPVSGTVEVVDAGFGRLVAPEGPPVRVTEILPAVRTWQSPSGRTLVDFGQNLVGWVRLTVRGPGEVTVRHAEVLENGELSVRPLRSAKATDTYVLPEGVHTVEPCFTFHGFRYAEVTGAAEFEAEAVVVGSDLRRTGWFECSDQELEQFHRNVVWGMRGNFLDVPTDCPQRDERLGWTGDIQIFSPTATFLFDAAGFLSSWLADLAADQHPDGAVPFVIPDVLRDAEPTATAWGDAAVVVPWVLYRRYGDVRVLERQFESMRGWVDKIASLTTDGVWAGGFQFGDWLDPDAPPDDPFAAKADPDVVATAHLARSAELVAEAARVLGYDPAHYEKLAAATRDAFARHYVTAAGRVLSDAPTVYALALEWALLPTASQRRAAGERLADLVRANGFRIATGFVGTPLVTDALCGAGRPDLAWRLLLEKSCPSWLYPVTMGATTIWERWDSLLPDGSVNPGEMTSFNHYALGAVADWMHRRLAGLAPAAPGYRRITVDPVLSPALAHAAARHVTPYGEAAVAWRRSDGRVELEVTVPPGTRATVHLPGGSTVEVGHGSHVWTVDDPYAGRSRPVETVRDVLDSARWEQVVAVLVEHGLAHDAAGTARRLARFFDKPAAELLFHLTRDRFAGRDPEVERKLADLLG